MSDFLDHQTEPEPRKLDVLAAAREAYHGAWAHFGEMVRLIWLPGILYMALSVAAALMQEPRQEGLRFLLELAALFLWPIIAVGWHRFVLIGDAAPGRFHLNFGRREARYLMVSILLGLLATPGLLIASISAVPSEPSLGMAGSLIGFLGILLLMVGIYYYVRLLLLLPAVAVDEPVNTRLILERTRGNFWRLVALVVIAGMPLFIIVFVLASLVVLFDLPPFIVFIAAAGVSVFFMIVVVAVLSIAYRELIGPPGTLAFDLDQPEAPLN